MKHAARCLCVLLGVFVCSPIAARAATVAAGASHTVVVKPDGTVWTWGANGSGQLGDGTTTPHAVPTQVPGLTDVIAVAAGTNHTIALSSDGTVRTWGNNSAGQLGDGTNTFRTSPIALGLSNVMAIAAGDTHSVALQADGTVIVWGNNANGRLGNGTTTSSNVPIALTSPTSVIGIAAGTAHTLALKSDGTVWAWGANAEGELGDTTTTQRTSPVQMSGITTATAVSAGAWHSLILLSDGTLKAAGWNFYGQLGDNSFTPRSTPVAVSSLTGVTAIAAGDHHSLALKSDGTLWGWGHNVNGELGDTSNTDRNTPVQVSGFTGLTVTKFEGGSFHSIAVTSDGVVWTWGGNGNGQLGDGTTIARNVPAAISGPAYDWFVGTPTIGPGSGTYFDPVTVTIAEATPGATIHDTLTGDDPTEADTTITSGSTVVIDRIRTLKARAWKSGMPTSRIASAVYTLTARQPSFNPGPSTYTSAQTVTITTTTSGATIHYTTNGTTPTEASPTYTGPLTIGTHTDLWAIAFKTDWAPSAAYHGNYWFNFGTLAAPGISPAAGTYTSSASVTLTSIAGATIHYTTDTSEPSQSSLPIYTGPITVSTTSTVKALATHPDYTTSAVSSAAYTIEVAPPTFTPTAGTYTAGQTITVSTATPGATINYTLTGIDPTTSDATIPSGGTLVAGNVTLKAKAFKTGATASSVASAAYTITGSIATAAVVTRENTSYALRPDGILSAWGDNGSLQIGDGASGGSRKLPVLAYGLTGITSVAAGTSHALAVRNDGTVVAWGNNTSGQLGDGGSTTRSTPAAVPGLASIVAVAAGGSHSLALKSDGTVVAWGLNNEGQLGDGTTVTPKRTPVAVSGLTNVTAIAAGESFSLAVKSDGTVWAWGRNDSKQLADGTTTSHATPAQITSTNVTGVTAIAGGRDFALALRGDGTVVGWGNNSNGQLGLGSSSAPAAPTVLMALSGITAVAAGGTHALALKNDGTVWAFGANTAGQLGDNTNTTRTSPVQVLGLSTIIRIAAGASHSLALDSDLTVWTWGYNASGQLGDGTTTTRWTASAISGPNMVWKVPAPTITLPSGLYTTAQTTTVTCPDPAATLHYTTNGVDPTASDPVVTSGGSLSIPQSLTLKVSGWKTGALTSVIATAAYELKAITPSMSPTSGGYGTAQSVTVTSGTPGATFTYTTDGSEPTPSSTAYSGAFTADHSVTVKARAYKTGWTPSDSGFASYWISAGTVATPTITPSASSYTSDQLITLASTTSGTTIRYTLDGSDPTGTSPAYVYPFALTSTTTVKARAFKTDYTMSAVASESFTLDASGAVATPAIAPAGGTFTTQRTVTITGASGATLHYTTTGVDPTESDPTITSGATVVVDRSLVLKVRGWQSGSTPSAIRRADFIITGDVAAGGSFSVALKSDGTVWAWGDNSHGEVGDGTTVDRYTPVQVLSGAVAIAAGFEHVLALKVDGTVSAWGVGVGGRVGDGMGLQRKAPVQVNTLTNVIAIAAGGSHSLALKSDGTVWTFGANGDGQLGDGSTTDRLSPVQVTGLSGVTAIAAGQAFSLAVHASGAGGGTLWAWGRNDKGQLGDGSTLTRTRPVQVPGLPAVRDARAGDESAYVVTTTGTVWAWGRNDIGQLGRSVYSAQGAPEPVNPLAGTIAVTGGGNYALSLDIAGRAWGWGSNSNGALGDGSVTGAFFGVLVPEPLPLWPTPLRLSAGRLHTLSIGVDGSVWVVGDGGAGRLGNGATTSSNVPIVVSGFHVANNTWLTSDADGDRLPTWREYLLGTDPLNADTNGNGVPDDAEALSGNPGANPDLDGDGVPNWIETLRGTDLFVADTDGDGVNDRLDAFPLDPTRTTAPSPTPGDTTPPTITLTEPTNAVPIPPL